MYPVPALSLALHQTPLVLEVYPVAQEQKPPVPQVEPVEQSAVVLHVDAGIGLNV